MVLVLEKNRLGLGASSTSKSTSTALLSTRPPDSLPTKLPKEPLFSLTLVLNLGVEHRSSVDIAIFEEVNVLLDYRELG